MKGMAIARVLDDVVAVDPDRTALIIAGESTSFGQLASAVGQAAAGLQAAGVSRGWRPLRGTVVSRKWRRHPSPVE